MALRLSTHVTQIVRSPSKSFAAAAICFSFGILVGPLFLGFDRVLLISIFVAIFPIIVSFPSPSKGEGQGEVRGRRSVIALFAALLLLGIWRYGQALVPSNVPTIADAAERSSRIVGTVSSEVVETSTGQRVILDGLSVADDPVDGRLQVWLDAFPSVAYGDALTFECKPQVPTTIDGFAYDKYLRSQGILALCFRPQFVDVKPSDGGIVASLLTVKRVVVDRLRMIVPEPHASFLAGLIFGGSSTLSKEMKDDFSATGTSHILAASGFNVSLFSMVFLGYITHTVLGRRKGAYLTAALLVAYVVVAGASAAVVRAGIMGSLTLVGFLILRKPSIVNVALLALAAMLMWNPLLLLDDVGFQLSFVATAAMLGWASKIEERCKFVPEAFELRRSFAASLAAIVATLPIILWHFGTVSLTSPIVNLLVLPLVPMLMAMTGIALAAGFVIPAVGTIVAVPAVAVSAVILHVVSWFGTV